MNHPNKIIVFGGSGMIGGAVSKVFGQHGWTVGIHYHRNRSAAQDTAKIVEETGGKGCLCQGDVSDAIQVHRILNDFLSIHKCIDVLVWAVGVSSSALTIKTSEEEWARILHINLTGAYRVFQAIAPIFNQQKDGSAILVGSLSGEQGAKGQAAYGASKAGLTGLMRSIAREWGSFNIRVNVVFPGWHQSPLSNSAMPSALLQQTHTLHRTPSLESIANSVYHLALSTDVSGQIWNLDSRIG